MQFFGSIFLCLYLFKHKPTKNSFIQKLNQLTNFFSLDFYSVALGRTLPFLMHFYRLLFRVVMHLYLIKHF